MRLPRTAGRPAGRAAPPPAGGPAAAAAAAQPPSADSDASSPRAVIGALPLARPRSKPDSLLSRPDGHAQDIVHLLNAGWYGPLAGSRAAAAADDEDEGPLPPPLPRRRGQAAAAAKADASAQQHSSSSPSTSGGGSQQGSEAGNIRAARPTVPQPVAASQRAADTRAAIQDLPGIGTWAGRYRLFGRKEPQQDAAPPGPAAMQQQQQQSSEQEAESKAAQRRQQPAAGPAAKELQRGINSGGGGEPSSYVVLGARAGGAAAAAPNPLASFAGFVQPGDGDGGAAPQTSYGSEQAAEDAWRWRFSRKWACEQQKYYEAGGGGEGEAGASLASDDLDPLAFTQACGMGMNLQLMPAHATPRSGRGSAAGGSTALGAAAEEGGSRLQHTVSNASLFDIEREASFHSYQAALLGAEMSPGGSTHGTRGAAHALQRTGSGAADGAVSPSPAAPAPGLPRPPPPAPPLQRRQSGGWERRSPRGPSATRSVLSMASKARDLLQKQGAIEAEVADRWERSRTAGGAWAGRDLAPARVDPLGRFTYLVLRVSDDAGHTRFVVRGHRGASAAALLQGAEQEAAAAARQAGSSMPSSSVEVVGEGVMEWREDTERELYIGPSSRPDAAAAARARAQRSGSGDSPTKAPTLMGDVSGLAASLLRQALPCHIRITTAGSSRSASAASLANRI